MRLGLWFLVAIATVLAFHLLSRDLLPPRTLTFAAGPEGGGYDAYARQYRQILARDGIDVQILTTAGSIENARLIAEGKAQVALLQGGVATDLDAETLGAVFLEPIFFFARRDANLPRNPGLWSGVTIAAGGEDSGTSAAFADLIRAAGLDSAANRIVPLGGADAANALLEGQIDLAVFVAPVSAPYLSLLVNAPDVTLLRLDHLEAMVRQLPQSSLTDLPSGSFSLQPPVPARDLEMLALVAWLVAEPGLHPSLVDRLVNAARAIHGGRDAVTMDGDFPNMNLTTLTPDSYARDLIASGPSPLNDYLPYWVVAQISRFAILLLPVLFLVVPLIRALPGLYVWRMRRRVFRHYATIREIDEAARDSLDPDDLKILRQRLEEIDREIASLKLPLPYREFAYTTRLHIDLLRSRIRDYLAKNDA